MAEKFHIGDNSQCGSASQTENTECSPCDSTPVDQEPECLPFASCDMKGALSKEYAQHQVIADEERFTILKESLSGMRDSITELTDHLNKSEAMNEQLDTENEQLKGKIKRLQDRNFYLQQQLRKKESRTATANAKLLKARLLVSQRSMRHYRMKARQHKTTVTDLQGK